MVRKKTETRAILHKQPKPNTNYVCSVQTAVNFHSHPLPLNYLLENQWNQGVHVVSDLEIRLLLLKLDHDKSTPHTCYLFR